MLQNRAVNGDIGTDGRTAQDRAAAAGYQGTVAEAIAINPALAINNFEVIDQWVANPAAQAAMRLRQGDLSRITGRTSRRATGRRGADPAASIS